MNNSPWPPKYEQISHCRPRLPSCLPLAAPLAPGSVAWPQGREVEDMWGHLERASGSCRVPGDGGEVCRFHKDLWSAGAKGAHLGLLTKWGLVAGWL